MNRKPLTIAMHGVTGRMGTNQHFLRSILAIIQQGGVLLSSGERQTIEPILLGRDPNKLRHLAESVATKEIGRPIQWSTDAAAVIASPKVDIVFDSASTQQRPNWLHHAIDHGKAVYCEKPIATHVTTAHELVTRVLQTGVNNGVVHDKLWLPGICKLRQLRDQGFFGRILNVRGDFGYWVFTGHDQMRPAQRPAWNYRLEQGGGLMVDMFCHWDYLINDLFGPIERVLVHTKTDLPERVDEKGKAFACTADDTAYAMFVLKNGVTCQFNSSWTTRVRRDDLLTIQIDGTCGSAVAGLRDCWLQTAAATPRATWNPDEPQPIDFYAGWQKVPATIDYDNAFKIQWELFIRHCLGEVDFPWNIPSALSGVQLAEAGRISNEKQKWVTL